MTPDDPARRVLLKGAALAALAFSSADGVVWLTPREARARDIKPETLTADEADTLAALGDILVPGAREAGLAPYVDQQLGVPAGECLLALRLLGHAPPYDGFYRTGIGSLDRWCRQTHGGSFATLPTGAARDAVETFRRADPPGWTGPLSPFFYYVVRSDAVDVFYGTVEGFERLGMPYMPHIPPARAW